MFRLNKGDINTVMDSVWNCGSVIFAPAVPKNEKLLLCYVWCGMLRVISNGVQRYGESINTILLRKF